jgi:hypothetical protein
MSVEEYDTLVTITGQVGVCIEQLDYLRQLVASIGHSTDNTDTAIQHLYTSQSAVADYMAEQYPNGRPDESSGGESESNENEGDAGYDGGANDSGGYDSGESEGSESSDEESNVN